MLANQFSIFLLFLEGIHKIRQICMAKDHSHHSLLQLNQQ